MSPAPPLEPSTASYRVIPSLALSRSLRPPCPWAPLAPASLPVCLQASSSGHPHIIAQFLLSETLDNAIALLQTGAHHPPEMGLIPLNVSPFPM